jgi:transposase InsO family protein
LVEKALHMACINRNPGPGLLHHSDRGSQYASDDYQKVLNSRGIVCSMSRKGNCWDNAVIESFFGTLKTELIYHRNYESRSEAQSEIFDYIEVFYNRQRLHSALGYRSPADFECVAKVA